MTLLYIYIYIIVGVLLAHKANSSNESKFGQGLPIGLLAFTVATYPLLLVIGFLGLYWDHLRSEKKRHIKGQPKLIGLVGYSGSGKDTAGDHLAEFGYKGFSFASELKKVCESLYGRKGLKGEDYYNKNRNARKDVLWTRDDGTEVTPVTVWVEVGTKLREVDPSTWLDVLEDCDEEYIVIRDVRHPNELKKIQELGGRVLFIDRDVELNPDAAMDGLISPEQCDNVIDNNDTLNHMYRQLNLELSK